MDRAIIEGNIGTVVYLSKDIDKVAALMDRYGEDVTLGGLFERLRGQLPTIEIVGLSMTRDMSDDWAVDDALPLRNSSLPCNGNTDFESGCLLF